MYYNFAAESFLSKKLCSRLHSIDVDFYSKKRKSSLFMVALCNRADHNIFIL